MDTLLQDFSAYPRWLVALGLALVAIAIVWVAAKVLKWTIYAAAAILLACTLAGIVLWWLGRPEAPAPQPPKVEGRG